MTFHLKGSDVSLKYKTLPKLTTKFSKNAKKHEYIFINTKVFTHTLISEYK